jgi:hypothetical protein
LVVLHTSMCSAKARSVSHCPTQRSGIEYRRGPKVDQLLGADPTPGGGAGQERPLGQRPQQGLLFDEPLANGGGVPAAAPSLLRRGVLLEQPVEVIEVGDVGDRDQVAPAEAADQALDEPLLVALPGGAVVGAEADGALQGERTPGRG